MKEEDKLKLKNYLNINLKNGLNFTPLNPNRISEDEALYISGMTAMKNQIFDLLEKYKGVDVPKVVAEVRPSWVDNTTKYQLAQYKAKDRNNEEEIKGIYISLGGKLNKVALSELNNKTMEEEKIEAPIEEAPAEEIVVEEAPAVE